MNRSPLMQAVVAALCCAAVLSATGVDPLSQNRFTKQFTPKGKVFPVDSYHGYISTTANKDDMFYWLFPPKNGDMQAPLLFWFSGGPGTSSEFASLLENGPFNLTRDGQVVLNDFGWNDKAFLVYVDQPIDVGYSHGKTREMPQTLTAMAEQVLEFMRVFYSDVFPEFKTRELYLSGESYAGNYIPYIANRLLKAGLDYINLKGLAIGNAWTHPAVQFPFYAIFSHAPENKAQTQMSDEAYSRFLPLLQTCEKMIKLAPPFLLPKINTYCNTLTYGIVNDESGKPKFNEFDIRGPCLGEPFACYDMSAQVGWLNSPLVLNELQANKPWVSWNEKAGPALSRFALTNDATGPLIDVLSGGQVRVLFYSGDKDYDCNWMGGEAWMNQLAWSRQSEFAAAQYVPEGSYGSAKTVGPLKFVRFFNAGHLVPLDNPAGSLEMINSFLQGWEETREVTGIRAK